LTDKIKKLLKGDTMRVKNYIIPAVIIVLAISMFVSGTSSTESIDALTRSSEDTATSPLIRIKKIRLGCQVLRYGDKSVYESLPKFNRLEDTESKMKKIGLKIVDRGPADGLVLLDIQLATSKATEFVAVNLTLSFIESFHLERIPIKKGSDAKHGAVTLQKSRTFIIHRNELWDEIQKLAQNMFAFFRRAYLEDKQKEQIIREHQKLNQTLANK
jgi:hypothetical protein